MSARDSAQDFDPKHRIIGAVVIVALAVVLIPMILGKREAPPTERLAAPSADEASAPENKVAVTPVPPPESARPKPSEIAEAALRTPPPPKFDTPVKTEAAPAKPATAPKPAAGPQAAASETKAANGWVVQVGTFSNAANATRMEQKLRAEGQPLLVENIQIDGGKAVRLRVGPFHDRAAAIKAQERIRKDAGVRGVILSYP